MNDQKGKRFVECHNSDFFELAEKEVGTSNQKRDFDISLQCSFKREMAVLFGFPLAYCDRRETLYFDESGNRHSVNAKGGCLNIMAQPDDVFVLGGVQTEDRIDVADFLKEISYMRNQELKSTQYFKGEFGDVLRKEHAKRFLEYVLNHGLHVHYKMVQLLYFGFVDIVDSVCKDMERNLLLKEALYKVLCEELSDTVKLFVRYKYPDVPKDKGGEFLAKIVSKIDRYVRAHGMSSIMSELRNLIRKGESKNELVFIQDELRDVWVGEFWPFYLDRIGAFPNKCLIFDNEDSVRNHLSKYRILNNGKEIVYSFGDSKTEAMILASDLTVGLLRKFFIFVSKGCPGMDDWTSDQNGNFKLLMKWLALSRRYNPLFAEYTCCISLRNQIERMIGFEDPL